MSVVLSNEEAGPSRRRLEIAVPEPAVEAETSRVVVEMRKKARLPGFRRGKVPRSIVERQYKEEIDREVIDRLVPRYWKQAEAELQLEPMLPPEVEKVTYESGEPFTFVATVEVRPAVALVEIDDIQLPEEEVEAGPADVDQALEDLRRMESIWNEVDREAARGDRVRVRIQREDEEEPKPLTFEVGDDRVWEELSLAVTGRRAGQEVDFDHQENGHFSVWMDAVEERELPPVDDELARKVGPFENLEALRTRVQADLTEKRRQELRQRRERALLDELCDRHPVSLPQGVVEQEVRSMLEEYARSLAERGVDPEKAEVDWAGLADRLRPQAERRVHARIVLDAIAADRAIESPVERVEEIVGAMARAQKRAPGAVRRELDRSGRLARLRRDVRRERVVASLLGEIEPDAETPDGSSA